MGIQFEIEAKDKDKARYLGASWDNEQHTWYITGKKKLADFSEWMPEESDIIINNPMLIAVTKWHCTACKNETTLIALGAEHFLQAEYENDDVDVKTWTTVKQLVLFSGITYLPKNIGKLIQTDFPFFTHSFSEQVDEPYWVNHCIHCNTLQEDWLSHNQPDGAFFPCSPERAQRIELHKIQIKHDFPIVGGYALGDSNELINKYARRKK